MPGRKKKSSFSSSAKTARPAPAREISRKRSGLAATERDHCSLGPEGGAGVWSTSIAVLMSLMPS